MNPPDAGRSSASRSARSSRPAGSSRPRRSSCPGRPPGPSRAPPGGPRTHRPDGSGGRPRRRASWSSGTTASALWPFMSSRSYEYQPARPKPIWISHGQTASDGASIVMPRVRSVAPSSTISSPGKARVCSVGSIPQVAHHRRAWNQVNQPAPAMDAPTTIRLSISFTSDHQAYRVGGHPPRADPPVSVPVGRSDPGTPRHHLAGRASPRCKNPREPGRRPGAGDHGLVASVLA